MDSTHELEWTWFLLVLSPSGKHQPMFNESLYWHFINFCTHLNFYVIWPLKFFIASFVYVLVPPDITEGPGTLEGVEGSDLSLSCKAEGLPQPEFQYYKVCHCIMLLQADWILLFVRILYWAYGSYVDATLIIAWQCVEEPMLEVPSVSGIFCNDQHQVRNETLWLTDI